MRILVLFFAFCLSATLRAASLSYSDIHNNVARSCTGSLSPVFTETGGYLQWRYSAGANNPNLTYQWQSQVNGALVGVPANLSGISATVGAWGGAGPWVNPGDGFWLIRPATAYKPMEKVFHVMYRPPPDENGNSDRILSFNAVNGGTSSEFYGVYSGGVVFGLQLVAPGGSYSQQISVSPDDTNDYNVVKVDLNAFSSSSDNPAGRGYLDIKDGDGNGSYTDPLDYISVPPQYTTTVGTAQNYSGSAITSTTGTGTTATNIVNTGGASAGTVTQGGAASPGTQAPASATGSITVTTGSGTPALVGGTNGGNPTGNLTEGTGGAGLAQVNATLNAIKQAIIAQGPNGGGTGTGSVNVNVDMSGVESRLDQANETLTSIDERMAQTDDDAEDIRNKLAQESARDVGAEIGAAYARGEEAGDALRDSAGISSIFGIANSSVPSHSSSGSSVSLPVSLQGPILVGGFGSSIDLSPTQSSGAQSRLGQDWSWFLSWVRHFIAATAVIWFCKEAVDAAKEACYALGATPQHKLGGSTEIVLASNVFGCSVGVIPAGVMWGVAVIAITAILIAAPTLLAAGIYTVANLSGVVSSFAASAGALAQAAGSSAPGIFAKVFALADAVCPIALLIVIALNRILLSAGAFVQFVALHVGLKLVGMI